jgi:hypothetical protein
MDRFVIDFFRLVVRLGVIIISFLCRSIYIPKNLQKISSVSNGDLLIFTGLGIALIVLALQVKIQYSTTIDTIEHTSSHCLSVVRAKCGASVDCCRELGFWSIFYLFSNILILFCSMMDQKSIFSILFYNMGFCIIIITSIIIIFIYIRYSLLPNFIDFWISSNHL